MPHIYANLYINLYETKFLMTAYILNDLKNWANKLWFEDLLRVIWKESAQVQWKIEKGKKLL